MFVHVGFPNFSTRLAHIPGLFFICLYNFHPYVEDGCSFNNYELHTVKIKEVLSYVDVLLSLERETNQKFNIAASTEIKKTHKFQ